jgi:hypothetical protein
MAPSSASQREGSADGKCLQRIFIRNDPRDPHDGGFRGLLADPAFYGIGISRGDGKLVVVLPGLLGSHPYLQPLRHWLGCIGYSPVRSTLDFNAGCLGRLREQVHQEIIRWTFPRPLPQPRNATSGAAELRCARRGLDSRRYDVDLDRAAVLVGCCGKRLIHLVESSRRARGGAVARRWVLCKVRRP